MRIDIYEDGISYVTDEVSTIPVTESNMNEENRIKFVTDLAAVSRGKDASNNPIRRYASLLEEAAPTAEEIDYINRFTDDREKKVYKNSPSSFVLNNKFTLNNIFVLLKYKLNEGVLELYDTKGNQLTDDEGPICYSFFTFFNLFNLNTYLTVDSIYTTVKTLIECGIPYASIPYNDASDFININYIKNKYVINDNENKPNVSLLHSTPLKIVDIGIGTCWDKHTDGDESNLERMDRVINKHKHGSISEHLVFNFYIKNISRCCLQELARHRIASPSVKSTRYTLKELKEEKEFCTEIIVNGKNHTIINEEQFNKASKFLIFTGIETVDTNSIKELEILRKEILLGTSNDKVKYNLPEAYKTELTWTINARSLNNFLSLRTDKKALWEIRNLAYAIFNVIPDECKFIFEDRVYKENSISCE